MTDVPGPGRAGLPGLIRPADMPTSLWTCWQERTLSENTVAVNDDSFEAQVLKADGPVLVDFWAEWCGPCKMIAPALEEIALEMKGRVTVAKVNIDDNPESPNKYGVRGIPTMILFKDGKAVATKVGAAPKSVLKDWVSGAL
jgi:thioredoxin 1